MSEQASQRLVLWSDPQILCATVTVRGAKLPSERFSLIAKADVSNPWHFQHFALSHVLFPFLVFKLGNLTLAVHPLINAICFRPNRDHGARGEESSSPLWIITNPLYPSFLPLDHPWPGYSTGFFFFLFPFFYSPPWLAFLLYRNSQGKYNFGSPPPHEMMGNGDQAIISHKQVSAFIPNHQVCPPDSWFMWKPEGRGAREQEFEGGGSKMQEVFLLLDKTAAKAALFSQPKGEGSVPTDQPKARECDFSYDG